MNEYENDRDSLRRLAVAAKSHAKSADSSATTNNKSTTRSTAKNMEDTTNTETSTTNKRNSIPRAAKSNALTALDTTELGLKQQDDAVAVDSGESEDEVESDSEVEAPTKKGSSKKKGKGEMKRPRAIPKYAWIDLLAAKARGENLPQNHFMRHPNNKNGVLISSMSKGTMSQCDRSGWIKEQLTVAIRTMCINTKKNGKKLTVSEKKSVLDRHFNGEEVKAGIGMPSNRSEFTAQQYANASSDKGLKLQNKTAMGDESRLHKLLHLPERKNCIVVTDQTLLFRRSLAGASSSIAIAAYELGYRDSGSFSAEHQLKSHLTGDMNLVKDVRELALTHNTAAGIRHGDNSRGAAFYHPDIKPGNLLGKDVGSFRKLTYYEQVDLLTERLPPGEFEKFIQSKYFRVWLEYSSQFKGGVPKEIVEELDSKMSSSSSSDEESSAELIVKASSRRTSNSFNTRRSSTNQPAVKSYNDDSSEDESSDDDSKSIAKPLARSRGSLFNSKSMVDSSSSDESSDDDSKSIAKPLARSRARFSFNSKSMVDSSSSDESSDDESKSDIKPSVRSRARSSKSATYMTDSSDKENFASYGNASHVRGPSMNDENESDDSADEDSSDDESFGMKQQPNKKRFTLTSRRSSNLNMESRPSWLNQLKSEESDSSSSSDKDNISSSEDESFGMKQQHSKKRPASPFKTAEDEDTWECQHCECDNDASLMLCERCEGAENPAYSN